MQITKQQLLSMKPCSVPSGLSDIITLDWALKNIELEKILWVLLNLGRKKEILLFAVFCARQNEHLLNMQSIYAINVVERFSHGMASLQELIIAHNAAHNATTYANYSANTTANAAYAAANVATYATTNAAYVDTYATNAAANAATYAADAAYAAYAAYVAAAAADDAAKKDQVNYLRSLFI